VNRRHFLQGCISTVALLQAGVALPIAVTPQTVEPSVPYIYCTYCKKYELIRFEIRLDCGYAVQAMVTHSINGRQYEAAILYEPTMKWAKHFQTTMTEAFHNRHKQLGIV